MITILNIDNIEGIIKNSLQYLTMISSPYRNPGVNEIATPVQIAKENAVVARARFFTGKHSRISLGVVVTINPP
jgi:hypothetical protein